MNRVRVWTDERLPFLARLAVIKLAFVMGRIEGKLPHFGDLFRILIFGRTGLFSEGPQ
jgi:hypothetical protein